ncbi:MAG: glutamine--fructose-6-phosphate transaminase (isomerizing) [Rhodospirillaceae bacterium]|nr:glutamine--fructose-6-phosphate transaminase (isomerizing) [Rhodospirillaceae bacterium]
MCGIIGVIGQRPVVPLLIDGLRRLEYRGYDSAGIATLVDGRIERRRAEGKLMNLAAAVERSPIDGIIGIGHTRWATHGIPNEVNAHPHATRRVAVVHNGIIENFIELRRELIAEGCTFETETDTEVLVHLLTVSLDRGATPQEAVAEMMERVEGAFALGILFADDAELLIGARRGSPLAVGYGDGEMYLGSDALALAPLTQRISYMEEGDWAELTRSGAVIRDASGAVVEREVKLTALSGAAIGKGDHRHFMQKEIHEQPVVIADTLHSYLNPVDRTFTMPALSFDFAEFDRVTIVACGTSFYAGLTARYWFEGVAGLPVDIDVASEYRYRTIPPRPGELALFISQSGETADTLAAMRHAKSKGTKTLAIVNVAESTMAREADGVLRTLAGPEIGVASTKAFTTQLVTLACLAIVSGRARGVLSDEQAASLANALTELPSRAVEVLNHEDKVAAIAADIQDVRDVLYIGRGASYPIALEGALKLKEISYIHAEGYAAGELKHGPIALIDEHVPVIVIAPSDGLFEKTASNLQEVAARGGRVILLTDTRGVDALGDYAASHVALPEVDPFVAPILYAIPVQQLAYHVAVLKGTDVDQPRNLAKSVTVE